MDLQNIFFLAASTMRNKPELKHIHKVDLQVSSWSIQVQVASNNPRATRQSIRDSLGLLRGGHQAQGKTTI